MKRRERDQAKRKAETKEQKRPDCRENIRGKEKGWQQETEDRQQRMSSLWSERLAAETEQQRGQIRDDELLSEGKIGH